MAVYAALATLSEWWESVKIEVSASDGETQQAVVLIHGVPPCDREDEDDDEGEEWKVGTR
jgi:hypothetical protein